MADSPSRPQLARRLGLFDAVMIVMGGIVGSGIFINPYVVARQVHTPALILGAWVFGGLVALAGAFVYAELASRRPQLGGQYAYIREAYHPVVAFLYGWGLLLVTQTGGMAAVAITFSRYAKELMRTSTDENLIAVIVLALLTIINCLGVRSGSSVNAALMVTKVLAIAGLVVFGLLAPAAKEAPTQILDRPLSFGLLVAMGSAVTPVLFAYGGWQTASFMSGELKHPARDLSRAMLLGVLGVIAIYLSANFVYLYALGAHGLAQTTTPASSVMRLALGERGASLIAIAITISTLGFLSQGMLTAPRVYFAMASDGLFFRAIARLTESTRAPAAAIALQGVMAAVIALSGKYEQILNYVVSVDFLFFGLTATCLFVFRKRDPKTMTAHLVPGHPFTTLFFIAASWLVAFNTVAQDPSHSLIGYAILASGVPAFLFWQRRRQTS